MNAPSPLSLEARGLCKRFGADEVLCGVDLAVPAGSLVCVVGKSGAGKSVFLKCLAGLLTPDAGEIRFEGRPLRSGDRAARAEFRRRCSYLFQGNALFDSLTALENVALPLEQTSRLTRKQFTERARDVLLTLELDAYRDHYPSQLSGGMQKRLALARALVTQPQLVLFDEPTAGLDPVRRNGVFSMIARYQARIGFTAVVVTHDLDEALVAGDRVALLDGGRIHFDGDPAAFVACNDEAVRAFRDSVADLATEIAACRGARRTAAPSEPLSNVSSP